MIAKFQCLMISSVALGYQIQEEENDFISISTSDSSVSYAPIKQQQIMFSKWTLMKLPVSCEDSRIIFLKS